jgi:drug/metabolite transporter (DMT)-like permease
VAAVFLGLSIGYAWFAVTFVGPPLFSLIQESVILLLAGVHSFCYNCYNFRSENHFLKRMGIFEPCEPESRFRWTLTLQWRQNLFYLALIGILGSLGSVFRTIALDKASINTVTGIVVVAPVISVFFGRLYYGERLSAQQMLAIFLIIAGVYGISYFRYYSF